MSRHWSPWTAGHKGWKPKLRGVSQHCERTIDMLNIAWGVRLGSNKGERTWHELREGLFCDLSQSVGRSPWVSLTTVTTSAPKIILLISVCSLHMQSCVMIRYILCKALQSIHSKQMVCGPVQSLPIHKAGPPTGQASMNHWPHSAISKTLQQMVFLCHASELSELHTG